MDDPRKAMGAHLRKVREARGVSRVDLANKLGVHQSAVTQWENGVMAPRLPHMVALREHLDDQTLYTAAGIEAAA